LARRAPLCETENVSTPLPALIFDLDGTLTDSKPGILGCLRKVIEAYQISYSGPLDRFVGPPVEEWTVELMPQASEEARVALARDYRACYDREGWKNNSVFPGVREMLTQLHRQGFPLYVCTSKQHRFAVRILEAFELAGLFTVLPHDDVTELMAFLSKEQAERVRNILSQREIQARNIMSSDYVVAQKSDKAGDVLTAIRGSGRDPKSISYIYVVNGDGKTLLGVVDLRDLVLAQEHLTMSDVMVSPVVSAEEDDVQDDLVEMFVKYQYHMIPVVDRNDRILGVLYHNDIDNLISQ